MTQPNTVREFTLSDFDFELPTALIAQQPAAVRSHSRLLDGRPAVQPQACDRVFHELPELLEAGDLLVFNDTRVLKARLFGQKITGGALELLVERTLPNQEVAAHMLVSKRPKPGTQLRMAGGFVATLLGRWPDAQGQLFHLKFSEDPMQMMQQFGRVPLPPYLHADNLQDEQRYQTVFARHPGAAAAPTAALHFDEPVLSGLQARGVATASVTLHVGAGTFTPVKVEQLSAHRMHAEWYHIPDATLRALEATKSRGGRVVSVGTTTTRTLESWAQTGMVSGDTQIFITPGFRFQVVDLLITNFHLPKSTLMMLVSAFAGYERVQALYRHAIASGYRFFSYGDAMLLSLDPATPDRFQP
jgi:S-adenosylmethionine:tRNA ribosyltransferase-isomerase